MEGSSGNDAQSNNASIDSPTQSVQPPLTQNITQETHSLDGKKKTLKPFKFVGILLGFVFVSIGSYYLGTLKSNQQDRTVDIQSLILSPTSAIQVSPTVTPNITPSLVPTSQLATITTWKPSIDLFTIDIPSSWVVTQADGGAGSVCSIVSPDYDGKLGTGSKLEIKFGPLSESYPENITQSETTVGNKTAFKMLDGQTVYYLVKGVYSPVKNNQYNILLVNGNNAPDLMEITEMLNSIIFEPTSDELSNARIIP